MNYIISIYSPPNPEKLNGARNGLTFDCPGIDASSVLHFTTAGGQTCLGQGAQGAHLVGSGHLTSGHLARGQGGHSPLGLLHLEQSSITGCCLGMDDFST